MAVLVQWEFKFQIIRNTGRREELGPQRRDLRVLFPQVARSGELSRSFSVCLSRASPRRHLLHAGRGGTGAEHRGAER